VTLLTAPSPSARTPIADRARILARDVSWTSWILVAALPILFVHIRYQPKVSVEVGSTSVDVSLADAAIAAVVLAAVVRGRRSGFAPLHRARWTLTAGGALVAVSLLSLATPALLGEDYAFASHAVTALKFAWYALLLPAVVLLVRGVNEAALLFRVAVVWSAVATAWGFLQFLGAVDEFEGRRPGQREPSFVGIHDFAALSGAALALGICAFVLTTRRPLPRGWATVGLVAGGAGVVLSGAMTGVIGIWLALLAVALVARARDLLDRRGLAMVVAVVLATTVGTALMRADALTRLAELVGLRDRDVPTGAESYPQRALLAYIGAKIWLDHPLTGVGWLASSEEWAYGPHLDDARRRFPDQPEAAFPSPEHPWGVQTLYVQVVADLGVLGLLALVALAAVAVAAGVRGARAPPVPVVGLAWLMVCVGVWAGLGIVAGIPLLALTWIALGLVDLRD
jgi:hypothetical protein